ncbi:hypothetical protein EYZ11_000963 [Aspergillus tanneri]|uniref:Uncharacterized protein n=1 Tax=Aspergillus tanneri TaxID=1220188 RepID=A0A4S3JVV9_9EURO|nr:hypothetical protein EYZ11_000963 [Aspergillus tanneri]
MPEIELSADGKLYHYLGATQKLPMQQLANGRYLLWCSGISDN